MPSHVRFPSSLNPVSEPVLQIRLATPPPGMSVGQTVEVYVLERCDDGRFMIRAGDSRLTAEAEQSLRPGQMMTMRVDSLYPRVVLSVLPTPEERVMGEHVRAFRSNPDALSRSLVELAESLGGNRGVGLARLAGPSLAAVLDAMGSALKSGDRIGEGFSVRDAARSLGLLTESDLKKALESPGAHPLPPSSSLKACLIRILREFDARLRTEEPVSADAKAIRDLTPVLERAVRAIERLQVVNIQLQESEGKLLFQVPLLFGGHAGKADILIREEGQDSRTGKRNGTFRVFFALEMDAMGDVMVQACFSGKTVTCRVDCASDAAASFVAGLLPELEDRLADAGCRVADLGVRVDSRVRDVMEETLREEIYGGGQTLSVFA